MKPENFRADAKRPLTSEEYLKSLQDGREIYIYGERVKDVTTHPAFRNAAASVAQMYDALHKPELQDTLCWGTDTRGITCHTWHWINRQRFGYPHSNICPDPVFPWFHWIKDFIKWQFNQFTCTITQPGSSPADQSTFQRIITFEIT